MFERARKKIRDFVWTMKILIVAGRFLVGYLRKVYSFRNLRDFLVGYLRNKTKEKKDTQKE